MGLLDLTFQGLSICSAVLLQILLPGSIAQERPVHTLVVAFVATAFLFLPVGASFPSLFQPSSTRQDGDLVPLEDRSSQLPPRSRSSLNARYSDKGLLSARQSRILFLGIVCLLPIRVEFYRRIAKASECTVTNPEVFFPLLVSIYDARRSVTSNTKGFDGGIGKPPVETRLSAMVQWLLHSPFRLVLPAFILSTGSYLALGIWSGINSTYICAIAVGEPRTIPLMQWANLIMDAFMAIALWEIASDGSRSAKNNVTKPYRGWSFILFTSSVAWAAVGLAVYMYKPQYRRWLVPMDLFFTTDLIPVLAWQTLLSVCLVLSTTCWVIRSGILHAAMSLTTILVTIPCLHLIWTAGAPYPPISMTAATLPLLMIFMGRWAYSTLRRSSSQSSPMATLVQIIVISLSLAILWAGWTRRQHVVFHPIETLMYDAKIKHDAYSHEASRSQSLKDAVEHYRQTYKLSPPPGFDKWYEYASNRSAFIVDEFDQIYNDLLPFRAIFPADLRKQTWEMVSNPWNEISGITIRNGNASVQENVLATHRWMLEGMAVMINNFARYLPDMDLAFNLNDEPRVSVPYANLASLRRHAAILDGKELASGSWSTNRSSGWLPIPEKEYKESIFQDSSFRNTFVKFGSIGCDPNSAARKYPIMNSRSHLCLECSAPHSLGQFLANWTEAADICHQPDLAHLHGFYMGPAAFKCSYELRPVFSQSRPHGFNDILYPSAWNYVNKTVYAPTPASGKFGEIDYDPGFPDLPYTKKQNILFWRGSTSEGVSSGDHAWRGMTRQRLVHLASNLTDSNHDRVTILLPEASTGKSRLRYEIVPGTRLKSIGLNADIAIVDGIAKCGGIGLHDCTDQDAEFNLVKAADFQSHWQYKFLFDLDGAAFSGRFLPFLQSKSLPFKSALFREWYDSRITAWLHFVPQDIRLHGVWSTLAYFAGINGKVNGRQVEMKAHLEEGETIAMAGREWANKVLRKEDMEIYLFRLLLEWARLTDDRRDELGFSLRV